MLTLACVTIMSHDVVLLWRIRSVWIYHRAHCTDFSFCVSIGRKKTPAQCPLHLQYLCGTTNTESQPNLHITWLKHCYYILLDCKWSGQCGQFLFFFFSVLSSLPFVFSLPSSSLCNLHVTSTMWVCFAPVIIIWAKQSGRIVSTVFGIYTFKKPR